MDEVRKTSNLIVTTNSLSTQDEIWSQLLLLFLQDSPSKPNIKKLAKAPRTKHLRRAPLKARRLAIPQLHRYHWTQEGRITCWERGTSSSSSSHQIKNRELFRMKIIWFRLSGHAIFSQPVMPVSRHGLFLNMSHNFYRFHRTILLLGYLW